ncbi:MAG: cytochrome b/b6 domain-containing protein [Candidatus Methanoperedens sp.]|nr:cytochrome b/b6 domain-containing protein [Candidatus Methanoperedens sp.]
MRIFRFDIRTRALHWSHAIIFIWLLATGIGLFLTPKSLLGDPLIKMVHLYASLPFILLPITIYIFGSIRTRDDVKELMDWTQDDMRWFLEFLKKNKIHVAGKFNAGQKANFLVTLLLIAGLSLSGFVVWMKSMFSVDFVELNFIVHDFFAILSALLLTGHIVFTLYYSESLRGIIYGEVDAGWAQEHYPDWFLRKGR